MLITNKIVVEKLVITSLFLVVLREGALLFNRLFQVIHNSFLSFNRNMFQNIGIKAIHIFTPLIVITSIYI